jgi:C4-dicarboxylate transporter, DctM subunit
VLWILSSSLALFLLVGCPLAFTLGISPLLALIGQGGVPLSVVIQRMFVAVDSFSLLAIPLFILAGELMNTGGITQRLVDFADKLVGHIVGGLAHVVIVTNMIMAGVSGSAAADAAATGALLIPSMTRRGYSPSFAGAISAAASTIGPIIPPSIPMVVYGSIANVSIGRLFLGGVIPGVIMGLFLMGVSYLISRKRGYPRESWAGLREVGKSFMRAFWAMFMPIIILGGILGGIFTPTEAAAVAVVYAYAVGAFVYREIRTADLPRVFTSSAVSTGVVMLIIATANVLGWVLSYQRIPEALTSLFLSISSETWVILLLLNIVLLILGCFMNPTAIIIIMVPFFMPLVEKVGINPIHFGVIVAINTAIGQLTPPVGVCMFISCGIAKITMAQFTRECLIFIFALIGVLFLVTYLPGLILYLPGVLMP